MTAALGASATTFAARAAAAALALAASTTPASSAEVLSGPLPLATVATSARSLLRLALAALTAGLAVTSSDPALLTS